MSNARFLSLHTSYIVRFHCKHRIFHSGPQLKNANFRLVPWQNAPRFCNHYSHLYLRKLYIF